MDGKDAVPLIGRDLVDEGVMRDAGVIDEDIDVRDGGERVRHPRLVRHVAADGQSARLRGHGARRRIILFVQKPDAVAAPRKQPHRCCADATAAAGDDNIHIGVSF